MQKENRSSIPHEHSDASEEPLSLSKRCNFGIMILGFWLMFTAISSDYRSANLFWSDVVCAVAMIFIAVMSCRRNWWRWLNAILGTWLLFAPLCFWAPTGVSYTNDTLVGTLVILLAFVIPGMPGARSDVEDGSDIPPGWSYNPSAWSQRLPLISLAMVGFFLARYMAAYQLGHVEHSWDPFFGSSTEKVLTSEVSRAFPISDAGLGALSYIIDALAGAIGSPRRWRTMPWMVLVFGFLVVPPGVVSITLVILQPVAVGAWCSLCLMASIVMLVMVPMTVDEVIATCQYMARVRREKLPFWSVLFRGGPELAVTDLKTSKEKTASIILPFNLIASAAIGVWLMLSPVFIPAQSLAVNNSYFTGALIVTVSFIAFAEVCRSVRFLNLLLAVWLLITPLFLSGFSQHSILNSVLCGIALSIFSIKRGQIREQYGAWNRLIV